MLEQVVRRPIGSNDRFWKKVYQTLQLISAAILLFCIWFGFSVNRYYWDVDRTLFWQACFSLLLITLPMACFVLVMQNFINKLSLAYDYELFENTLTIFRLSGNSRKRYLSFELAKVSFFKDVAAIRPDSQEERYLRSAKQASCNPDAPHLVLVQADCIYKRSAKKQFVVLELNDVFYETLCKKLRSFNYRPEY